MVLCAVRRAETYYYFSFCVADFPLYILSHKNISKYIVDKI